MCRMLLQSIYAVLVTDTSYTFYFWNYSLADRGMGQQRLPSSCRLQKASNTFSGLKMLQNCSCGLGSAPCPAGELAARFAVPLSGFEGSFVARMGERSRKEWKDKGKAEKWGMRRDGWKIEKNRMEGNEIKEEEWKEGAMVVCGQQEKQCDLIRAISERFRDKGLIIKRHKFIMFTLLYFTLTCRLPHKF